MKRILGVLAILVTVAGLMYGYAATQRERLYRQVIERGDAALARDDGFAAIEAFSVAISLKSDSMAAHLKRGEAYRRRGEYEAALRDLRRAADIDPISPLPPELLGDVHYALAAGDRNYAPARFARAVEYFRQSLALDDSSTKVEYKLALAAYRSGQIPLAIDALRQAIRLDARFVEAHYLLGVCLRANQQVHDAIRSLDRAVSLSPAFLPGREELAAAYAAVGRNDDRLQQLAALLALQPTATRARALAQGYAQAGHFDRAVAELGRATQRYPDDTQNYLALARLWLSQDSGSGVELKKALAALTSAVNTDSSSDALTLYGRALLLSGEVTRAERILQRAVSRFPVDPLAFLYLSDAATSLRHTDIADRALIHYATMVRSDGFDSPRLVRLAEAFSRAGNGTEALRAADAALLGDPGNATARAIQRRYLHGRPPAQR